MKIKIEENIQPPNAITLRIHVCFIHVGLRETINSGGFDQQEASLKKR